MKRNEIWELRSILKNPEVQRDRMKCRKYLQQVIAYMTLGLDVSSLFTEMIKASATNDLVQKKLVYLYIRVQAKSNKDIAILVISTLTKDSKDDNPIVRGLALRTMCELKVRSLLDYIKEPLLRGLSDKSVYVQKIAVLGCLKVFHFAPDVINDMNIVNLLLDTLTKKDCQVMANSIYALREMLFHKESKPFPKDIVANIFSRIHTLGEWPQSCVTSLLSSYQPSSQEEVLSILNRLDNQLMHSNKGLVLATAKLFLIYTKDLDSLKGDVYKRLIGPLCSVATSPMQELSYTGLCTLLTIYRSRMYLLSERYKTFFLRGNELPYLKRLKLSALVGLSSEANVKSTLSELSYYAVDANVCVAKFATKCIGRIATKHKSAAASCLAFLMKLLRLDLGHVVACVFEAMKDILTEVRDLGNNIVANIHKFWEKASDPSAQRSVIWILGEFGHSIPRSPYILESIANSLEQQHSSYVKLELLSAAIRLFFKRPPEFQNVLGSILCQLIDERVCMDVHDRAIFYYRILRQDASKVLQLHKMEAVVIFQKLLTYCTIFLECTFYSRFLAVILTINISGRRFVENEIVLQLLNTSRELSSATSRTDKHLEVEEVWFEDLNTIPTLLSQHV